jgi:hypothetical protein
MKRLASDKREARRPGLHRSLSTPAYTEAQTVTFAAEFDEATRADADAATTQRRRRHSVLKRACRVAAALTAALVVVNTFVLGPGGGGGGPVSPSAGNVAAQRLRQAGPVDAATLARYAPLRPAPANATLGRADTAVALVSIGAFSHSLKCEAAVETLRRCVFCVPSLRLSLPLSLPLSPTKPHARPPPSRSIGGYTGKVYVFTDRQQCWSRAPADPMTELVHVDDASYGSLGAPPRWTVPSLFSTRGARLRAKLLKARLFDLLPSSPDADAVRYLLYLDCDVLVAEAGCAKRLLDLATDSNRWKGAIRMRLKHLGGHHASQPHGGVLGGRVPQTGLFVAHRERSREALAEWGRFLATGRYAADREAYRDAWLQAEASGRGASLDVDPLPDGLVRFADVHNASLACATHVTRARCLWQGRDRVQRIVDRFGLKAYDAHGVTRYCESAFYYPFTYGWLPFPESACTKLG